MPVRIGLIDWVVCCVGVAVCADAFEGGVPAVGRGELDNYSRYIIAWKLCTTMKASDVTDTLELTLQASGCDQVNVRHRPRLFSDNGASYIASELAKWLDDKGMDHVRGAPNHPQTQGKIASQRCKQRLPASGDVGIKRSRTEFCWKTTFCQVI